jgi:hypothetical protein
MKGGVIADLEFNGKNFQGTVVSAGLPFELIKIGNDLYLKAPEAFWEGTLHDQQQAALLTGKYVKTDSGDPRFKAFAEIGDLAPIRDLKKEGTLTKGGTKVINGIPAIALMDDNGDLGTLYVATQGEPYPLRWEDPRSGETAEFGEFNTIGDIKPPPGAVALP